jgi:hypothetical protein
LKEERIGTDGAARPRPTLRAQQIRTGLAWLHAADPVLARVVDDNPDFDPTSGCGGCLPWTCSAL